MALRNIRLEGDPILTGTAVDVTQFDATLSDLVRDLFATMYDAPGRGLAAPQVGVGARVFVVDTEWKEHEPAPMLFVNPQITAQSQNMAVGEEACLSIPDQSYAVARPDWIEMVWQDLDGQAQNGRFSGVQARCICHENDHLDGILITQIGSPL